MNSYVMLVPIAILILAGTGIVSQAFAETTITMETDKDVYDHSSVIIVTGYVEPIDLRGSEITIIVQRLNPIGITHIDQISPSGGSFMTTIEVGGQLWSQDGMYTVSAQQGQASNYQTSAEVEIVDGHIIPEFGVIAAMILAVAIVSIIVVTAKTKLSIVPRY